jgi:uncharacterized membrane protein (DUF2068 family)
MLLSRPAVALLLLRLGERRADVERLLDDFFAVDLRAVERFAVERLLDDFLAVDFLPVLFFAAISLVASSVRLVGVLGVTISFLRHRRKGRASACVA